MKVLLRTISLPKHTVGILQHGDFTCTTIELPDLDNQQNLSCIPAGLYQCRKHHSPTHGKCIAIGNVTGRTDVLIHIANFVHELRGCIGIGESLVDFDNNGTFDVTSSRKTLRKLLDLLPNEFLLEIKRC